MKFGGTSVGDIDKIKKAAERIKKEISQGNAVVAVVSAMAGETNRLIELVKMTAEDYNLEEYDTVVSTGEQITCGLLAIALNNIGIKACLLYTSPSPRDNR